MPADHPTALDLDIGTIGKGVDLFVNVEGMVRELAFDTDLSATGISFSTTAPTNGVVTSLDDPGFSCRAGADDAGSFSISMQQGEPPPIGGLLPPHSPVTLRLRKSFRQ